MGHLPDHLSPPNLVSAIVVKFTLCVHSYCGANDSNILVDYSEAAPYECGPVAGPFLKLSSTLVDITPNFTGFECD